MKPRAAGRTPERPRRSYWHLEGTKTVPDEYTLGTTELLYYPRRGFEVNATATRWYEKHQRHSALVCTDWDAFADPERTTYATYTTRARAREARVEAVLRAAESLDYDRRLDASWVAVLGPLLGAIRFPLHGLQMVSAYAGSMAPGGRLAVALLFQTADELRRVEGITQRMVQLGKARPEHVGDGRESWQSGTEWQGLRALVEKLLVTYDFGEALVALNVCVKPALDELLLRLPEEAMMRGDPLLGALLLAWSDDCAWQRGYTRAFLHGAQAQRAENSTMIRGTVDRWLDATERAMRPLEVLFARSGSTAVQSACRKVRSEALSVMGAGGAA